MILLFLFWPDAGLSTPRFEYVYNLTNSGNLEGAYQSCYKRCNESNSRSDQLECMCDIHCMFIGDCCYDYLMECDYREFVLSSALAEQSHFHQRFKRYSQCIDTNFEDNTKGYVLQISTCPEGNVELTELCKGTKGSTLPSWFIPVTARGILFGNVYCAACHGIRLMEVEIAEYHFECANRFTVTKQLMPFQHNFKCKAPIGQFANKYKSLGRTCVCAHNRNEKMYAYSECEDAKFKDECHAYAAVVHPHGHVKVLLLFARKCSVENVTIHFFLLVKLWCQQCMFSNNKILSRPRFWQNLTVLIIFIDR